VTELCEKVPANKDGGFVRFPPGVPLPSACLSVWPHLVNSVPMAVMSYHLALTVLLLTDRDAISLDTAASLNYKRKKKIMTRRNGMLL
jgi:hypothetical protein